MLEKKRFKQIAYGNVISGHCRFTALASSEDYKKIGQDRSVNSFSTSGASKIKKMSND